jgi:hypothetical protein
MSTLADEARQGEPLQNGEQRRRQEDAHCHVAEEDDRGEDDQGVPFG